MATFPPRVRTQVPYVPHGELAHGSGTSSLSQYAPVKPAEQVQEKPTSVFEQFPPFWHVTLLQLSSCSRYVRLGRREEEGGGGRGRRGEGEDCKLIMNTFSLSSIGT